MDILMCYLCVGILVTIRIDKWHDDPVIHLNQISVAENICMHQTIEKKQEKIRNTLDL